MRWLGGPDAQPKAVRGEEGPAATGHVACGSVVSDDNGTLGARLRQIFDGLSRVLAELAPVEAAIEQTFVNRDASATLKLGHARGIERIFL